MSTLLQWENSKAVSVALKDSHVMLSIIDTHNVFSVKTTNALLSTNSFMDIVGFLTSYRG